MRVRILAAVGTTAALALAGAVTATSADAATVFTCSYTLTLTGSHDTVTVTTTPIVNYVAKVALTSNPLDMVAKRISSTTGTAAMTTGRKGIPSVVTPAQITVSAKTTVCTLA